MATVKTTLPALRLLVDSGHGIYVPRVFARAFNHAMWTGIRPEDVAVLESGPDHAHYWETWDDVTSNAKFTEGGYTWLLHQDGDLWAYCFELMTDAQKIDWGMADD